MTSQWAAVGAGTDLLRRARQLQMSWERLLAGGVLEPGVSRPACSEASDDTFGIGAAFAPDHARQVFGCEHVNQRDDEWVCSGNPVRDSLPRAIAHCSRARSGCI